ncbi:hypothetical protein HGO21_47290 [Acinetobacter sp. CUI P1]|nr:hypothetical protein [Acinetobacter sp. CUI P1]
MKKKELIHSAPGKLVNINDLEMHFFWKGMEERHLCFWPEAEQVARPAKKTRLPARTAASLSYCAGYF